MVSYSPLLVRVLQYLANLWFCVLLCGLPPAKVMSMSSSAGGGAAGAGAFGGVSVPRAGGSGQCPQDHSLNGKEKLLSWEVWCQHHVFTKKTNVLERLRCKSLKPVLGVLG